MNRIGFILLLVVLGAAAPGTRAEALEDAVAFEEANRFYEEGRFQEAIHLYQSLLTNAPGLAVHFNLGNAYYKAGELGNAIAEYRTALALNPRDPDVLANLQFARERVRGPSHSPGWVERSVQRLTLREWRILGSVPVWIFFGLLILRELQPRWRKALPFWLILSGAIALLAVSTTIWVHATSAGKRTAVVIQRDIGMRLGPFEESERVMDLHNGAELRVLDATREWLQVTADDVTVGWIPETAVRVLDP